MTRTGDEDSDPSDTATNKPRYDRVLLKLSGEAFCKPGERGIDGEELELIANEIVAAHEQGAQLAIVVGGGNMVRGSALAREGRIDRTTGDYMGMLGTVVNGLALKDVLDRMNHPTRVLSALNLTSVAETFIRGRAIRHLEKGRIVIFVAGTGNPFFTTDSAAALRAAEIDADAVLKATKVDGIYDKDPFKHDDAVKFDQLSFREAIDKQLGVMDLTAFSMCMERSIPVVVFNMKVPGHIAAVVRGETIGTRVE